MGDEPVKSNFGLTAISPPLTRPERSISACDSLRLTGTESDSISKPYPAILSICRSEENEVFFELMFDNKQKQPIDSFYKTVKGYLDKIKS